MLTVVTHSLHTHSLSHAKIQSPKITVQLI